MKTTANDIYNTIFKSGFVFSFTLQADIKNEFTIKDKIAFARALYEMYAIQFSVIKEMQNIHSENAINYFQGVFSKEDLSWLRLVTRPMIFIPKVRNNHWYSNSHCRTAAKKLYWNYRFCFR